MKRLIAAVFALTCMLTLARSARADQGTLFGIADDLTVQGTDGTYGDADVEIYGLTVLGPTRPVSTRITGAMPGSLIVTGSLEVSGSAYLPALNKIMPSDIGTNSAKILRVNSDGTALEYVSANEISSTANTLTDKTVPLWNNTDKKFVDSAITQDAFGTPSLVTISTNVLASGKFHVVGDATLDAKLNVAGDVDMASKLTVHNDATFVSSVTVQGRTQLGDVATDDGVGINTQAVAGVALKVVGKGVAKDDYTAQFYSGTNLAAWIIKK